VKHLIDVYHGERQRLTYELAKVVDYKVDALAMRVSDLRCQVKGAKGVTEVDGFKGAQ
jgi:hypothetical protein